VADGVPLHDGLIVNGSQGQIVDNAATLRMDERPWAMKGNIALSHVEGHVAALMRKKDGPQHVDLVVTREPCKGRYGCDERLAEVLPRGSTLSVYVRSGGQLTLYKTFIGTGEAVLPYEQV
jgi:hypothetical protein